MTCRLQTIESVDRAICQIDLLKNFYCGTYVSTEMNNAIIKPNHFIVILVLNKNQSIGHYIVAHRINFNELNIFCSLGINPKQYKLQQLFKINTVHEYWYSNVKLQSDQSNCCAYFCLFFLYKIFVNGLSFKHFLNLFEHQSLVENESIVHNFVKTHFLM